MHGQMGEKSIKPAAIRPIETIDQVRRRLGSFHNSAEGRPGSANRVLLLIATLLALYFMYRHLPHQAADPIASRYHTLTITVRTAGQARNAYEAFTNLQYLNINYEDPGIYWLVHDIVAAGKVLK